LREIELAGKRQPKVSSPIQEGQDEFHVYEALCIDLADTLGYSDVEVQYYWSQVAIAREKENGEPRDIAEYLAWRNVRDALDRRGRAAD
jgi:hypothetical protein